METGLTIRPAAGTTLFGAAREESVPLPKAVPTELEPEKAVIATGESGKIEALPGSPRRRGDNATSASNGTESDIETLVIFDTESRDIIFRMIDVRSKQIIDQIPDHALLRLRAYSRAIENGESVIVALARTDTAA
ncbi:hypothetical protein [Blastochloris viridis]|uniref:Flagellar protein FlaG n=1 Tax=Blastochloris viridis TaxID=1079 RepID=A0A0P0J513_BLAVI|nr:hypothetical protein [Blastochloris viridis]ALK08780.1 hypothetical protein BVIR_989 [Blastochloris viridis]CUU41441.1 hypothetical protein BVIRIDIS_04320 [Blastochloris viridis]